jgi:hypothetical protein
MKILILLLALCACTTVPVEAVAASGKPASLQVSCGSVTEGQVAHCSITKSGGNGRAIKISWATANGTAKSPGDYTARSGVNSLGSTPITVSAPTIDDTLVDATRTFTVNATYGTAKASGTVTILDNDVLPPPPPAMQTCWDNSVILATAECPAKPIPTQTCFDGSVIPTTSVCPTPPPATQTCGDGTVILATAVCPPPAPAPVPAVGWLPSPSLSGLPSIPSNFDVTLGTKADPTATPSSAPDVVGAFRFICTAGQVKADDPIVYPGKPGASHLHQFYGNAGADAFSDYASLRQKGGSTCNKISDAAGNMLDIALNRSAYWMPAMLNGLGYVVRPDYVIIYYKRRPASDPMCSSPPGTAVVNSQGKPDHAEGLCLPLPNGLRFIYGFNMLKPSDTPTGSMWFNCSGPTAVPGHYLNLTQALANCPPGNRVGAVLEAPECWDGKNLDSPDHRSHVGYPSYGSWGYRKCDAAHPYVIPTFTLGAWYSIVAGDDTTKWELSSDAMFPNLPKGSTLHADWFGAWDDPTMAAWTDNCINKMLNCSAGLMGNGMALQGAAVSGNANPRLVPVPAGGM